MLRVMYTINKIIMPLFIIDRGNKFSISLKYLKNNNFLAWGSVCGMRFKNRYKFA